MRHASSAGAGVTFLGAALRRPTAMGLAAVAATTLALFVGTILLMVAIGKPASAAGPLLPGMIAGSLLSEVGIRLRRNPVAFLVAASLLVLLGAGIVALI